MATLLKVLEVFFLIVFGIQIFYLGLFSIASLIPYSPKLSNDPKKNKIVVFIPGYKEDRVIIDTAIQSLNQSYPKEFYQVVVLADQFKEETIAKLREHVRVIEVKFANSTKAKSLNKGLEALAPEKPDIAVVLDADNLMATDFLQQVNAAYNAGHKVVQGHRTAKNQETAFALLDAINEEIGNNIFRKGHRVLGLSSGLIGSAMAFDFCYFKDLMADILDISGEDKFMELKILKGRESIEYIPGAKVYDEKVSNAFAFSKQRTRWVGAQLYFFKHFFLDGVIQLFHKGNFGYFDKAFQMSIIPKILTLGVLVIMGTLGALDLVSGFWTALVCIYFVVLLMAMPRRYYNYRLLSAILHIPLAIVFMILGILRIRRSTASTFEVTQKKINRGANDLK